ncbi:hypothetical protein KBY27_19855 [Ruegeria pomeroyi]|uniref:Uncharacterized protein n=1 Tax=Ruegeria pomeroyi TaxID=89184 RepID=A0A9Q3WQR6_9RHOB|nr:hypothetical protein [Ruegeria pomeroyi]MCE8539722.1 hypothetical protein [Ruegeria pomeroyi]
MTKPNNIAVNADYLALIRRYAEIAGMSVKAAVEYAVDQVLVPVSPVSAYGTDLRL